MNDIATSALLALGTAFTLFAALGLVRMPDFYTRMQAMTKGTTLGVGLIMGAVALHFTGGPAVTRALAIVLFFFATSPAGGQMLSRAAYLLGVKPHQDTHRDDLADVYKTSPRTND